MQDYRLNKLSKEPLASTISLVLITESLSIYRLFQRNLLWDSCSALEFHALDRPTLVFCFFCTGLFSATFVLYIIHFLSIIFCSHISNKYFFLIFFSKVLLSGESKDNYVIIAN